MRYYLSSQRIFTQPIKSG